MYKVRSFRVFRIGLVFSLLFVFLVDFVSSERHVGVVINGPIKGTVMVENITSTTIYASESSYSSSSTCNIICQLKEFLYSVFRS